MVGRLGMALVVVTLSSPVLAQISPAQVTPERDRQLWCGVAFSVVAGAVQRNGEREPARLMTERSRLLMTRAAEALLISPAQTAKDFQDLVARYTDRVSAPFAAPEISEADCVALAEAAR